MGKTEHSGKGESQSGKEKYRRTSQAAIQTVGIPNRNVLEDLGRLLEELINQHYQTGKPLASPGLINGQTALMNSIT